MTPAEYEADALALLRTDTDTSAEIIKTLNRKEAQECLAYVVAYARTFVSMIAEEWGVDEAAFHDEHYRQMYGPERTSP